MISLGVNHRLPAHASRLPSFLGIGSTFAQLLYEAIRGQTDLSRTGRRTPNWRFYLFGSVTDTGSNDKTGGASPNDKNPLYNKQKKLTIFCIFWDPCFF